MYVAKNCRNYELTLREPFLFIQEVLKLGNSLLHHLSGLQNKWQDEIPCAKPIANLFHRGQ